MAENEGEGKFEGDSLLDRLGRGVSAFRRELGGNVSEADSTETTDPGRLEQVRGRLRKFRDDSRERGKKFRDDSRETFDRYTSSGLGKGIRDVGPYGLGAAVGAVAFYSGLNDEPERGNRRQVLVKYAKMVGGGALALASVGKGIYDKTSLGRRQPQEQTPDGES